MVATLQPLPSVHGLEKYRRHEHTNGQMPGTMDTRDTPSISSFSCIMAHSSCYVAGNGNDRYVGAVARPYKSRTHV